MSLIIIILNSKKKSLRNKAASHNLITMEIKEQAMRGIRRDHSVYQGIVIATMNVLERSEVAQEAEAEKRSLKRVTNTRNWEEDTHLIVEVPAVLPQEKGAEGMNVRKKEKRPKVMKRLTLKNWPEDKRKLLKDN